jgi:hypothetical protein
MNWAKAIERNREALLRIVAALFALLRLREGGAVTRIPRALHSRILRELRPAEAALRRLIVIAARGLVVKPPPSRPMPAGRIIRKGGTLRPPAFPLVDPKQRLASPPPAFVPRRAEPRIHFFDDDPRIVALPMWSTPRPEPAKPPPDGLINAKALCRRLEALKLALADVPRQARRLARWRARQARKQPPKPASPLRSGRPPGYRRKPVHEADEVLIECHHLAAHALKPDTS